jgi:hypothetical protein
VAPTAPPIPAALINQVKSMNQSSETWRPGERPDQPATHPYDPNNPDQQPNPQPLPIPPDGEPQPAPIREPNEPMPATDPAPTEPPRIA